MADPAMLRAAKEIDALMGKGFYRVSWQNKLWPVKLWYTLRGLNPGGRRGVPSFEEVEGS